MRVRRDTASIALVQTIVVAALTLCVEPHGAAAATNYSGYVLSNPHVVAYWNFDEASGNAIQLKSGYSTNSSNELAPLNGATRATHASLGSGLALGNTASFDGINDVFRSAGLNFDGLTIPPQPYGFEMWFQRQGAITASYRNNYILNLANAPAVIYGFDDSAAPTNHHELEFFGSSGFRSEGVTIADNNWHHLLIVHYGAANGGPVPRIDMYVDGIGGPVALNYANFSNSPTLASALEFGAGTVSGGSAFEGRLDELAFYHFTGFSSQSALAGHVANLAVHHTLLVPEPMSVGLLALGGIMLLGRRGARHSAA